MGEGTAAVAVPLRAAEPLTIAAVPPASGAVPLTAIAGDPVAVETGWLAAGESAAAGEGTGVGLAGAIGATRVTASAGCARAHAHGCASVANANNPANNPPERFMDNEATMMPELARICNYWRQVSPFLLIHPACSTSATLQSKGSRSSTIP